EGEQHRQLRAHAAREGLDAAARRQVEFAQVLLFEVGAPSRVEGSREGDDLADRHVVVKVLFVAHEGGAPADFDAGVPVEGRLSEHPRLAAIGPRYSEQDLDRCRLAGAVPAEEAEYRSRGHLQIESAQRLDIVIALPQPRRFDYVAIAHRDLPSEALAAEGPPLL